MSFLFCCGPLKVPGPSVENQLLLAGAVTFTFVGKMNPVIVPFFLSCSGRRIYQEKPQVCCQNHIVGSVWVFIWLEVSFCTFKKANKRRFSSRLSHPSLVHHSCKNLKVLTSALGEKHSAVRTNQRGRSGSSSTNERRRSVKEDEKLKRYHSATILWYSQKEVNFSFIF